MSDQFFIVGVLNVTPDSYYDGGQFNQVEAAVSQAGRLLDQGADVIEIGGESTGPGSKNVSSSEELARVLPVIESVHKAHPKAMLAIDTYKAEVAKAAIKAGVTMVNDVRGGRGDEGMFKLIAENKVKYVLMYAKDESARTTSSEKHYQNVIGEIVTFFTEQVSQARSAGITDEQIILDPGLGHFVSRDPEYSFEIIAKLDELNKLGFPLLLSPSRKSFLAGSKNLPPAERLPGTVAASAIAVLNGATYIRTHDVAQVKQACEVALATAHQTKLV